MRGQYQAARDPGHCEVRLPLRTRWRIALCCTVLATGTGCGSSAADSPSASSTRGGSGSSAASQDPTAGQSGSPKTSTALGQGGASGVGGTTNASGETVIGGVSSLVHLTATGGALGLGGGGTPVSAVNGGVAVLGGRSSIVGTGAAAGKSNSGGNASGGGAIATMGAAGDTSTAGAAMTGGSRAGGGTQAKGGTSATGPVPAACGTLTKTLGSSVPSPDAAMERLRVTGMDCKSYVVQNNNFGDPANTAQVINVVGSSFTIESSSAVSASEKSATPASFPSIYLGAHGDIAGGTYSTWSDSGLPKKINTVTSIFTTLKWSGGKSDGDFAATCAIWFSKASPTAGSYDDAASGSLQIWLSRPPYRDPRGSQIRQSTVSGHAWNVWIGTHETATIGTDDPNRPIVTYVLSEGALSDFSFDLAEFIKDAVKNGPDDMSRGKTSQALSSTWYVSDIFGGFEIWSGADAATLKQSFTSNVK